MKREGKKILREKEKALEKAIKLVAKKKGYKSIMGFPYKIVDGFLYETLISTSLYDKNGLASAPNLYIYILLKPLMLDEIYWKVFDMYEEAKKQPESFHVKGAFTARGVMIDNFYQDFFEKENQETVAEEILQKVNSSIENNRKQIFNIKTFETFITNKPNQELNKILISIIQKDYLRAENMIDDCMKKDVSGGSVCGTKDIIEYAKEYISNYKNK